MPTNPHSAPHEPAPQPTDNDVIFYQLPARDLEEGMSTLDGQDYLDVSPPDTDGWVWTYVYTRHDNPRQDAINRSREVTRIYRADDMVDLAMFPNTKVDGSTLPRAVIIRPTASGHPKT